MNTKREQNQEQRQEQQPAQHLADRGSEQQAKKVGPWRVRETFLGTYKLRFIVVGPGNEAVKTRGTIRRGPQTKYWKHRDTAQAVADLRNSLAEQARREHSDDGTFVVEGFGTVDRKRAETLIYRHTHPDFKGTVDGVQTIMLRDPQNGGSRLFAMSALSDGQIMAELPYALKKERERTNR